MAVVAISRSPLQPRETVHMKWTVRISTLAGVATAVLAVGTATAGTPPPASDKRDGKGDAIHDRRPR